MKKLLTDVWTRLKAELLNTSYHPVNLRSLQLGAYTDVAVMLVCRIWTGNLLAVPALVLVVIMAKLTSTYSARHDKESNDIRPAKHPAGGTKRKDITVFERGSSSGLP
jgi:hypothetical protein